MKEKSRVRSAYAVSTISVTLVLFLIGAASYFIANAAKATDAIIDQVKVSLVVKDDITPEQSSEIITTLDTLAGVERSSYISKEQAIKNFSDFIDDDVITAIGVNPLPAAYDIYFDKDASRAETINTLNRFFEGKDYVEELIHQTDRVDQLVTNLSNIKLLMAIFGAVLLFISIILINNTIRANIFAKRFIINTMLLIGATAWFVRKPFLIKAIWQGLVATLFAFLLLMLMVGAINRTIPMAELINAPEAFVAILIFMALLGVTFCVIMTNIAVGRYIRQKSDQLHVY